MTDTEKFIEDEVKKYEEFIKGERAKYEKFYQEVKRLGLVKLTESEKSKIMKKALTYYEKEENDKIIEIVTLLYYDDHGVLDKFEPYNVVDKKKGIQLYLFTAHSNIMSVHTALRYTAYTTNKKRLMEI